MKQLPYPTDWQAQNTRLLERNRELEATVATLSGTLATLTATVAAQTANVQELSALVAHFKELFAQAQRHRFGVSSEKSSPGQLRFNLVNGLPMEQVQGDAVTQEPQGATTSADVESTSGTEGGAPPTETITYIRKKQVGKRKDDLSKLPLEIVEHELPEAERVCPECGESLQEIGVDTRDEIKIIPPQVIHVRHRCHVYKCTDCEQHREKTPIVKATMPEPVMKGSIASPSLIAHVMAQKYVMHLPLYRLEQDFKRQGAPINRANMTNWVIKGCEDWLEPVYERLHQTLRQQEVLHIDETSVQVLKEPGKKPQTKSQMWMYRTGGESPTPIVLYEYQPDREGKHPKAFLTGCKAYCHTDGYKGYHSIPDMTIVGCWAHARRYFNDAYQLTKTPGSLADIGLTYCNRLFELERTFEGLKPKERKVKREELSKPIAEALFAWAASLHTAPKLSITKAITYLLNQRQWLMNVYLDGRLELSNNRGERSIKPFVMGRKNWLFSQSVAGAKASAVALSLIETAKENGLKPFEYLTYLFERLPNVTSQQLDELLPWSQGLPAACRMPE